MVKRYFIGLDVGRLNGLRLVGGGAGGVDDWAGKGIGKLGRSVVGIGKCPDDLSVAWCF